MNGSLIDDLLGQLQGAPAGQIAQQLGTDPNTAQDAIAAALPMIVGALGRNAQQPGGATDLFSALQRDHGAGAGGMDLGSMLGGLLGGGNAGGLGGLGGLLGSVLGDGAPASRQLDAGGILGHIFGGAQPRAESGLGQATGLNSGQAGQLLKILAPIVLAFIAQRMSQGGAQNNPLGLAEVLGQEQRQVQQQGGLGGGLLGAVLDQDGDGQLGLGDILKIGSGMFGGGR